MVAITRDDYRRTIGTFATGVAVITMARDGELKGVTVNAVSSLSLEPLLLLVCIARGAYIHPYMVEGGAFTVNVLASDQEAASRQFSAGRHESLDLFGLPHRIGETGAPILDNTLSFLECRVQARLPGGDHDIFVGEVVSAGVQRPDAEPLIFYKSGYTGIAPAERGG